MSSAGQQTLPTGDFSRMDRANDPYQRGYQDREGTIISDAEQLQRVMDGGPMSAGRGVAVYSGPRSSTAVMGAAEAPWSRDRLRRFEIDQRNADARAELFSVTPSASTSTTGKATFVIGVGSSNGGISPGAVKAFIAEGRESVNSNWGAEQDRAAADHAPLAYLINGGMKSFGNAGYSLLEMGAAILSSPGQGLLGARNGLVNFGPEGFNASANLLKTSLNGYTLMAEGSSLVPDGYFSGFRESEAYNISPLFANENNAQSGGSLIANLATAAALTKFGGYNIRVRSFSAEAGGTVPVLASEVSGTAGVESLDTIARGNRVILRPIEIEFPAAGLSAEQQGKFAAHLAEQQSTLNRMSLTRTADFEINLANYDGIQSQLASARRLARGYLPGSGAGLDAAHSLDAIAGGYVHEFVGFRDPIQQRIGALWRTRVDQIVPGREHRLVPKFE